MTVTPPEGHPLPGHPSPEEVEAVMKEFGWSEYMQALQYLLIQEGNPDGIDAPDA
jgi:hypothetical protein